MLVDLLQKVNPFSSNGSNYTRDFFRLQWEHQVNYLDFVANEENKRRKKLTKLLEKEEALKKLRYVVLAFITSATLIFRYCLELINRQVLETRDWDVQADLIERIINEINKGASFQRELAGQLGLLYNSDTTDGK